jgi:hypothetical protein
VVGLAVEPSQLGADIGAHLAHEVLAISAHGVGERPIAGICDEDQVAVRVQTALALPCTSSSGFVRGTW